MFLLVLAHPGSPRQRAVKQLLLMSKILLLLILASRKAVNFFIFQMSAQILLHTYLCKNILSYVTLYSETAFKDFYMIIVEILSKPARFRVPMLWKQHYFSQRLVDG